MFILSASCFFGKTVDRGGGGWGSIRFYVVIFITLHIPLARQAFRFRYNFIQIYCSFIPFMSWIWRKKIIHKKHKITWNGCKRFKIIQKKKDYCQKRENVFSLFWQWSFFEKQVILTRSWKRAMFILIVSCLFASASLSRIVDMRSLEWSSIIAFRWTLRTLISSMNALCRQRVNTI